MSHRVIKGMECTFDQAKSFYHVIVKKEVVLYPHEAPERPGLKVFRLGCFTGASVE